MINLDLVLSEANIVQIISFLILISLVGSLVYALLHRIFYQ